MAGMYHVNDLLHLVIRESAEELLLEPDQPPRIRLAGKVRVLDGPLLTTEQVSELLRSMSIRVLQKPFDEQTLAPAVEGAVERLNAPPDEPLPWAPEN